MIIRPLLIIFIMLMIPGCSYFNGTRYENILGKDTDLISMAYRIADDLEKRAYPRLIARHPDQPILTTTFVDNNKLEQTSHFSRILQEHMTSRFVQRGYTVREIKLRDKLHIQPKIGETMLSRDLKDINNSQAAQAIMVGTYSFTERVMYISARLVNPNTSNIISAADYKFTMDKNILAMFSLQLAVENEIDLIDPPSESTLNKIFY